MFIVGIGSGMFNSPEHRRDDGHRRAAPPRDRRRRPGAGAEHRRGHLDRVRPRRRHRRRCRRPCCSRSSPGWRTTSPTPSSRRFISNMHTALWCLAGVSVVGAAISAARPKYAGNESAAPSPRRGPVSRRPTASPRRRSHEPLPPPTHALRIGELAELTGTTPRTIRYYEEIGLLGGGGDRVQGKHRVYTEADVERVREIVRLRDLLGLSLEQLAQLLEAESARAEIRRRASAATEDAGGAPADPRGARSPHRHPARARAPAGCGARPSWSRARGQAGAGGHANRRARGGVAAAGDECLPGQASCGGGETQTEATTYCARRAARSRPPGATSPAHDRSLPLPR